MTVTPPRKGLSVLWLILFVIALVVVPYLFWQGVWFGRKLTDTQLAAYLDETEKPRHIQHALSQIADGIVRGDTRVKKWYPRVIESVKSPTPEVRVTAAWVMGQDNRSDEFHAALINLLDDPNPMVRRNAALALVRFGDPRGRPVLVEMLQPFTVTAPASGALKPRLKAGDTVDVGTLLARVNSTEVRSPVTGKVARSLQQESARVAAGAPIYELGPAPEQIWEALRALYLVGTADDLPAIVALRGMPERIQQQARLTAQAIRARAVAVTR